MSIGTIILIILIIALLGGFTGIGGGPFYGTGYYGEYKGTGGAFTTAFVTAITEERRATDTNANGAIELAELYAAVKRHVMSRTKGKQTPWIARNQMIGEMPLF